MDSLGYARAVARSWWLILIAVLAGTSGGYLLYSSSTKLYQSSVQMIVASVRSSFDEVTTQSFTAARATTLAEIAQTAPAIQSAFEAAGRPPGGASVTASSSGSFVTIVVTSPDPQAAFKIAAAFPNTVSTSLSTLAGASGTPFKLNVVSNAFLPTDFVSPSRTRDLGVGLAAGLILGLALALLREALDKSVRDSAALRELTGLTVLGTVPRQRTKTSLPARDDPRGVRAEAYRQIRTSLLSRTTRRPLTLAVTSASNGEGKTSVACNLAAIFSRAGHHVALVDADLRRPRVSNFFDISPTSGLADVLLGKAELDDAMVIIENGFGVLPAGRGVADPSELLGSKRMVALLNQLASTYEFVIIDTPPVLPVTDALILGPLIDGVVLVSRLRGVPADRVLRAIEAINRVNAGIIGVVPNQSVSNSDRVYGYSYNATLDVDDDAADYEVPTPADPAWIQSEGRPRHRAGRPQPERRRRDDVFAELHREKADVVDVGAPPTATVPTEPSEATEPPPAEAAPLTPLAATETPTTVESADRGSAVSPAIRNWSRRQGEPSRRRRQSPSVAEPTEPEQFTDEIPRHGA